MIFGCWSAHQRRKFFA
ncbi:hypothetical protein LINPERHAP2_LOCUS21696 [Linum perenne]